MELLNFQSKENLNLLYCNTASLAQLVEQLIRNEQVAGSSPVRGSLVKIVFKR